MSLNAWIKQEDGTIKYVRQDLIKLLQEIFDGEAGPEYVVEVFDDGWMFTIKSEDESET